MPEFANLEEIRRRSVDTLINSGLDDASTPGTVTSLLVQPASERQAEISADSQNSYINQWIQNASGFHLDFKGEELGLRRATAAPALILAKDKNLRFFTNRGTLLDRLGSKIPAGTLVSTADGTITFAVNETNVPAGVNELFVTAVAQNTGGNGNVAANTLTTHSLLVDDVQVTNVYSVTSGRSTENDDSYRARLLRHARGTTATTADEIISQVLALPGVTDAYYRATAFGVNHPAIMLSGPERLSQAVVSQAEALIAPLLPLGTRLTFLLPKYLNLNIGLVVRRRLDGANAEFMRATLEAGVRSIITSLRPGAEYDFNRIDSELTRRHPDVLNVDIMDIRLDGRTHSNRRITLADNEQLLVERVQIELLSA